MAPSDTRNSLYLKEMGIQTYFPRRALPGARPSRAYAGTALPVSSVPEQAQSSAAPRTAKDVLELLTPRTEQEPTSPEQAVQPRVLEKPRRAPASRVPTPQEKMGSEERSAVTPQEDVRFAYAYIPINEHLAVINELPWSPSATVSPACRTMLANILAALEVPVQEQHLNAMVFTWPLYEGGDLDSENARQALHGFLAKRLRLRPVRYLLVMAEQSTQFLFPRGFLDDKGASFQHPRLEVSVLMTHSLSAMEPVRDPELGKRVAERKRKTWQVLQSLKGKLSGAVNAQGGI